jgi:hypothetical protein
MYVNTYKYIHALIFIYSEGVFIKKIPGTLNKKERIVNNA